MLTGGGELHSARRPHVRPAHPERALQAAGQVPGGRVVRGAAKLLQGRLVQLDPAGAPQLVRAPAGQTGRPDVAERLRRQVQRGRLGAPPVSAPRQTTAQLREEQRIALLRECHWMAAGQDARSPCA